MSAPADAQPSLTNTTTWTSCCPWMPKESFRNWRGGHFYPSNIDARRGCWTGQQKVSPRFGSKNISRVRFSIGVREIQCTKARPARSSSIVSLAARVATIPTSSSMKSIWIDFAMLVGKNWRLRSISFDTKTVTFHYDSPNLVRVNCKPRTIVARFTRYARTTAEGSSREAKRVWQREKTH